FAAFDQSAGILSGKKCMPKRRPLRTRAKYFARREIFDIVEQLAKRVRSGSFGREKFAGRNVQKRPAEFFGCAADGGEKYRFAGFDKLRIDGRPRCYDANDLAVHELRAFAGGFGLFAYSDAVAFFYK